MGSVLNIFTHYTNRMSSQQVPKKVQDVQPAPVVGPDPTAPEAILARNAKTVQLQADSDSTFDTVLERFSDSEGILVPERFSDSEGILVPERFSDSGSTTPLLGVGLALFSLGILMFLSRFRKN
jgi:hypothetical protein